MAVAEARAAWQRSANRCFVQEDAKRAPKLSRCPSSSAASITQVNFGPTNAAAGEVYVVPASRNPSYKYIPPNLRGWPQPQPLYGGLTNEQLITLEADMEMWKGRFHSKTNRDHLDNNVGGTFVTDNLKAESSLDTQSIMNFINKDPAVEMQKTKNVQELFKMKAVEKSFEFIDMDPECWEDSFKLCSESGTPWSGGEKSEPWWRTADRDELASFVEQRSLDLIDNCDLPKSQNTHIKKAPYAHVGYFDHDSSRKNQTVDTSCNGNSGLSSGSNCAVEGNSESGRHSPIRVTRNNKGIAGVKILERDSSKAELLEALMHTQTRAREAEKAAKQAYEDKERVVKLFFEQASHLFALKQWFQIQQLENFYLQIKNNKNFPLSDLFQVALPWMPQKTTKIPTNLHKAGKGSKRNKQGC